MSIDKRYADFDLAAEDNVTFDGAIVSAETITGLYPTETATTVKHLLKIGAKTESFSREALELGKMYSDHLPRGLNLARMEKALEMRNEIRTRYLRLLRITERLRTTMLLLGVDAYGDGLTVYNSLKRGKDETLRQAVNYLGRHFNRVADEEEPAPDEGPAGTSTNPPV
jgi:hypothetical protein